MGWIRVSDFQFNPATTQQQTITIKFKLQGYPDSSYQTVTTTQVVNPNGSFVGGPYYIYPVPDNLCYDVLMTNNCNGQSILLTGCTGTATTIPPATTNPPITTAPPPPTTAAPTTIAPTSPPPDTTIPCTPDFLLQAQGLSSLRNDVTAEVGFRFTMAKTKVLLGLSRYKAANASNQPHTLKLTDANGNNLLRSGVINNGNNPGFGFYVNANVSPIILLQGQTYCVLSTEFQAGDQWYNGDTTVTPKNIAVIIDSVYRLGSSGPVSVGASGTFSYGPLQFVFCEDEPATTLPVTTIPPTTAAPITTAVVTTLPATTIPPTTEVPATTVPPTTAEPGTTDPLATTLPPTTAPITTAPITTAPVTTIPPTTIPATTLPPTTAVADWCGTISGDWSVSSNPKPGGGQAYYALGKDWVATPPGTGYSFNSVPGKVYWRLASDPDLFANYNYIEDVTFYPPDGFGNLLYQEGQYGLVAGQTYVFMIQFDCSDEYTVSPPLTLGAGGSGQVLLDVCGNWNGLNRANGFIYTRNGSLTSVDVTLTLRIYDQFGQEFDYFITIPAQTDAWEWSTDENFFSTILDIQLLDIQPANLYAFGENKFGNCFE